MTLQNHLFHTLFSSSSCNTPENFCTVPLLFFCKGIPKFKVVQWTWGLLRIKKEVPSFRFTLFEVSRCMNSNVFWSICRVNFMQKSFLSLSSKKWVALPSLFSYSSKTLTGIPSKKSVSWKFRINIWIMQFVIWAMPKKDFWLWVYIFLMSDYGWKNNENNSNQKESFCVYSTQLHQ